MSNDLTDRLVQQAARRPSRDALDAASAVAGSSPSPRRRAAARQKVTMDLDVEGYEALRAAAFEKRTTMADIVRTLVRLWQLDPDLARRVDRDLGIEDI